MSPDYSVVPKADIPPTQLAALCDTVLHSEVELLRAREAEENALRLYKEATNRRDQIEREFRELSDTITKLLHQAANEWVPPNERANKPSLSLADPYPSGRTF